MSVGFPVPFQFHVMPMQDIGSGGTVAPYLGYVECDLKAPGVINLPHLSSPHLLTGTTLLLRNISGFTANIVASAVSPADNIDGASNFNLASGNSLHLVAHPVDHTWKILCECEVPRAPR